MESSPGSRWEDMEEAPVTAATGALGPVVAKLAALLGSEYKLRRSTRRDVKFIRSKLKPVHSILWNIWGREELDAPSKALKMEALDLADELDDAIVDFILSLERGHNTKRLIQTKTKESPFQDFKKRASDVSGRCRGKWKEEKNKKPAYDDSRPGKPRAYPFVRKDASELVGLDEPRDALIQHLAGEDEGTPVELQLKTASIFGLAGMGKTTLADLVYQAIGSKFESRAFVSITPGDNIREVLARILEQVAAVPLAHSQASTEEHLLDIILNFLKDKRYLVIIDDIWNWREWEVIMKCLPENNLGSRVVGTTRTNVVAEKWREDSDGPNAFIHEMIHQWRDGEGWVNKFDSEYTTTRMLAMKANLVAKRFRKKHPIVVMCGATPLAVLCMLSAVAQEREKQGQHAKIRDVQNAVEKHLMEDGIQNTPGFEALVESLQLGFDDLPHHMLKTCLLYCSIYPEDNHICSNDLVRRWISEGFVCKEEQANGYVEELVNRGFIMLESYHRMLRMDPMMRNFLRWKSHQDNFISCSSKITPSYHNNTCRIRRLCICNSPYIPRDVVDPLSALDWYRIRSLVVCEGEGMERVPFDKLQGLRLLDLCWIRSLLDECLKKNICGLVRLRHLLGLDRDGISGIPSEIGRMHCLRTLEVRGDAITELPREIGDLQQLQILRIKDARIRELPREIESLQQLKNLYITNSWIRELPREIGALHQLETLDMCNSKYISELPKEIGRLQQLRTLDIHGTAMTVLPKEIGRLRQLKTLDISHTPITVLPKEMGKLEHLEHLLMVGTDMRRIPREIGGLKELKSIKMDEHSVVVPLEVCHALALVDFPECIHQELYNSDLLSDLGTGGLAVGAKQMHIPSWIKEHFNDLNMLDIRVCKLEEQGLKILREMPRLRDLTLRFQVVPTEPVVISSQGFAMLWSLCIDGRLPRMTFQEGAMPVLEHLTFQFQFYAGPPDKGPVGINHLKSISFINFECCNKEWYQGDDSPCISSIIDVMREEALELPLLEGFKVCGKEEIWSLRWRRTCKLNN